MKQMLQNYCTKRILVLIIFVLFLGLNWLVVMVYHLNRRIENFEKRASDPQARNSLQKTVEQSTSIHQIFSLSTNNKLPSMEEIGRKTGTDKVLHHRYYYWYPRFVEPLRSLPTMKMLEIGFLFGQSYLMWKDYFPNGKVYFMDITPGGTYLEARFTGDSGNVESLSQLLDTKKIRKDLDLIVDDGSHFPPHQITAFGYLFLEGLKPGGVYIIEDIETSYWQSGECYGYYMSYGRNHPDALITRCKSIVDVVNRKFSPDTPQHRFKSDWYDATSGELDRWISSVSFGLNHVIITKATQEEYQFLNGGYSYPDNVIKTHEQRDQDYQQKRASRMQKNAKAPLSL